MKKLFLLFLFFPVIVQAQWSIAPEAGILFSKATGGEIEFRDSENQYLFTGSAFKLKTGYSVGCKVSYKLLLGLKFSSGVYYTNETYYFPSGWYVDDNHASYGYSDIKYGSLSIPALLGYDLYLGKVLLSANAGAAYSYGLTLSGNDFHNIILKDKSAVNIVGDVGVGYKIFDRLVLKLLFDYSQRVGDLKFDYLPYAAFSMGKPYHVGIKAGVEILL